jgi:chemotaxis signal transduction protein
MDYMGGKLIAFGLAEVLKSRQISVPNLVVVIGIGDARRGLFVERVSGEVEIVARPLPGIMKVPSLITGATEMHDGRPAVVVRPEEILRIDRLVDIRPCHSGACDAVGRIPAQASRAGASPEAGGSLRAILFRRGGRLYAIAVESVEEIVPPCSVTGLAAAGESWEGICFIRGACYGLLRIRAGEHRIERIGSKIITLRRPANCGIWVDEAVGDCEVRSDQVEACPERGDALVAHCGTFVWRGETARLVDPGSEVGRRLNGDLTESAVVRQGTGQNL